MAEQLLELEFCVQDRLGRPLAPELLHAKGAELMDALLDLEKVNSNMWDSATASDAEGGNVTVEMVVEADDPGEAVSLALALCRTAIHAIGGSTPQWSSDSALDSRTDFVPKKVEFANA